MAVYLKQFSTHAEYEAYIASEDKVLPNVSICEDTPNDVHYNPMPSVSGVTLNKSALSLGNGETETLVATVLPSNAGNKNVTWSSSNESVATVSNNGLVTAVGNIGDNAKITVTTVDGGHTAQCACNIIDPCASEIVQTTYEWVEIGGVKWATKNVGALTVTDYGQYFSWGGVNGYTNEQVSGGCHAFSWTDYEYGNGGISAKNLTKYNSTDGLRTLEASDDAATVNMGSGWRMPTYDEWKALGSATTSAWTTDYQGSGVAGLVLTSNADSSNKLFFPAAGCCLNSGVYDVGSWCYYPSNLLSTTVQNSVNMSSNDSSVSWASTGRRSSGSPVRGIYIG